MGAEFYGSPRQQNNAPLNLDGSVKSSECKGIVTSAFFLGGGAISAEELEYTGRF
jgi:hypothetical protein